jgi:hypothetical protein
MILYCELLSKAYYMGFQDVFAHTEDNKQTVIIYIFYIQTHKISVILIQLLKSIYCWIQNPFFIPKTIYIA